LETGLVICGEYLFLLLLKQKSKLGIHIVTERFNELIQITKDIAL